MWVRLAGFCRPLITTPLHGRHCRNHRDKTWDDHIENTAKRATEKKYKQKRWAANETLMIKFWKQAPKTPSPANVGHALKDAYDKEVWKINSDDNMQALLEYIGEEAIPETSESEGDAIKTRRAPHDTSKSNGKQRKESSPQDSD